MCHPVLLLWPACWALPCPFLRSHTSVCMSPSAPSLAPLCCFLQSHFSAVTSLALSSDGWVLLSGGRDKVVTCWDLRSHSKLATVPVFESVEGEGGRRDAGRRGLSEGQGAVGRAGAGRGRRGRTGSAGAAEENLLARGASTAGLTARRLRAAGPVTGAVPPATARDAPRLSRGAGVACLPLGSPFPGVPSPSDPAMLAKKVRDAMDARLRLLPPCSLLSVPPLLEGHALADASPSQHAPSRLPWGSHSKGIQPRHW